VPRRANNRGTLPLPFIFRTSQGTQFISNMKTNLIIILSGVIGVVYDSDTDSDCDTDNDGDSQ
jgi:hypothetical protein